MKTFVSLPRGAVFDTFFTEENVNLIESLGEVVWNTKTDNMSEEDVAAAIGDCEVYMTLWGSPRLDEKILQSAPKLRLLTHLGGTVVPFVSDAMWKRGIRVISGNAYFAESVAEGALAYILAALRDIPKYSRRLKEEKVWGLPCDCTRGLMGKSVGIVSYGEIARHLVRILSSFKVNIKIYDIAPLPSEDMEKYGLVPATLEEIFSECDIISIHTPLYEKTFHMIGKELLSLIKPDALLVNTSRGAIVDQRALEEELSSGSFRAVLDVYETEPPENDCRLFELPNVMMLPHMGGPTTDLRSYITRELILESAAFVDCGMPLFHEISAKRAEMMSKR